MKLTILLLISALVQVRASDVAAQNVSISGNGLSLRQVFSAIEKQTGYVVLYNKTLLSGTKKISLNISDAPLRNVLDIVLKDSHVKYTIADRTIVLSPKASEQPSSGDAAADMEALAFPIKVVVTDSSGNPLAGATVSIRNSRITRVTDSKGTSDLNVNSGDVLEISFVGYQKRILTVGQQSSLLTIVLRPVEDRLDEVVISTGYSEKKVAELTGAVQKISGEELRRGVSGVNALAMLKGKASGLYIVENGGSVAQRGQVVLRGQASMPDPSNTNFGPLIVVDGVITTATNLQDIVDPTDIESITILKDAASTAIYGSRAAQGVIVVVTRHGGNTPVKVNLSMSYGPVYSNRLVDFMSTEQLAAHIRRSMESLYAGTPVLQTRFGSFDNYFNSTRIYSDEDLKKNFSWTDEAFYPNGKQRNVNLSLSGGTERSKVYAAVNWTNQDGTELGDNLERKAFRLNLDQRISKKLLFSMNSNVLLDKYTATTSENQSYLFQPWVTPYYSNGQLADSVPNYIYNPSGARITQWYDNPQYSHSYNTAITRRQNYLLTGKLKYDVLSWLSIQSTNTVQHINNNVNSYRDPRTYRGRYNGPANNRVVTNGEITITDSRTNYFLTSNMLTANRRFGDHVLNALVGQEYGKTYTETMSVSAYGTAYPGERNLGAFQTYGSWTNKLFNLPATPGSAAPVEKASFSLFGEINDSYMDRYFASASIRRDASTNFGRQNRYGNFYSLSAGWLISKENFMYRIKPVTNLKLRAAYGTSGREAGADFLNFTTYSDAVRYNDQNSFGSTIQRLANDQITWETTYTTNIGMDLGLWKRVNLTVDFYNRRSAGLLQSIALPTYMGFPTQIRNVGELTNKGVEVNLSAVAVKAGSFQWQVDANISFNRNRLTKIYGDSLRDGFTGAFYRHVGEDINILKAIRYVGVNPDNGRPLFERINGDKTVTIVDSIPLAKAGSLLSYQTVGSATPKFFGGFTSTFVYKGITLSMLFNYSYGNRIMNNALRNFMSPTTWQGGFNTAAPTKNQRFWQGPGDTEANYPNWYDIAFAQRGGTNINSSLIYHNASYLRLRNIRLSYDINRNLLARLHISSLNVYVSADNVFVLKSKELYAADPEGATIGGTSNAYAGTGIYSAMPKRLIFGLNIGF